MSTLRNRTSCALRSCILSSTALLCMLVSGELEYRLAAYRGELDHLKSHDGGYMYEACNDTKQQAIDKIVSLVTEVFDHE